MVMITVMGDGDGEDDSDGDDEKTYFVVSQLPRVHHRP